LARARRDHRAEADAILARLQGAQEELMDLRPRLEAAQAEAAALSPRVEAAQAEVAALRDANGRLEAAQAAKAARIEALREEFAGLQAYVERVHGSRSYRVMGPLRRLGALVRGRG
jgi:chromosome segregation ATPase